MTTSNDGSVVWILGSGFSKSLGGPLLPDFFSDKWDNLIKRRMPDVHALCVRAGDVMAPQGHLPNEGRRIPVGAAWSNAEEFLELAELAALDEDRPSVKEARAILKPDVDRLDFGSNGYVELARCGRRYLAAACSCFVPDIVDDSERWSPYRAWVDTLDHADTIVSFNYDRVVEVFGPWPKTGFERPE